jgi:hypothetical protein
MPGLLVAIAMSKTTGATFINNVWKMLLIAEPLLNNALARSATVHTVIDFFCQAYLSRVLSTSPVLRFV